MKNKIAPPFRDAEFDIMFDRGISYEGDLLDLAALANVVEKSGAWYNYKTTRLGQGRENAKQFLFENKDLAEEIRHGRAGKQGPARARNRRSKLQKPPPTPVPKDRAPTPPCRVRLQHLRVGGGR